MSGITYRSYRDGDETAILDLYNRVFTKQQSLSQWRWAYRSNPSGRVDISLAFDGQQLIAQSAGIPLQQSHEGRAVRMSRIQNVLVHPDYRGRGVFTQSLLHLTEHLQAHDVDFVLTFPNDNSVPGFLRTGAYERAFDLFQFCLDASSAIEDAGERLAVEIEDSPVFRDGDIDFIGRMLAPFAICNIRDRPYLAWRYHRDSGMHYRVARAFQGREQLAFAVFKVYPPERCLDLVEFLVVNDEGILRSFLRAILTSDRNQRMQAVSLWSMPHYPTHEALLRVGFERSQRVTHAMYRTFSARCAPCCADATSYYLSMGDSDVY